MVHLTLSSLDYREIGIKLNVDSKGQYIVKSLSPSGVASNYFHVKENDQLLSVNGEAPDLYPEVHSNRSILGANEASFLRHHPDGTSETYNIHISEAPLTFSWIGDLAVPGATLSIFFILAFFLYSRKKDDAVTKLLIAYFLAIGFTDYSAVASASGDLIGGFLLQNGLAIVPVLFLHFIYVYLAKYNIQFLSKRTLLFFYGIWSFIVLEWTIYNFTSFSNEIYYYIEFNSSVIFFLASSLYTIYKLFATLRRYRDTPVKSIIKLILTGQVVAYTPIILLTFLPAIFNVHIIASKYTTAFLLILPFIYFYIIMAERFLDIEIALTKFKYYSLITFIPAIFFLLVFMAIFHNEQGIGIRWIQMFLVFYFGFVTFLYIKEKMDIRIKPRLFKQLYDFQSSLDRFSKNISKVMKRSDLEMYLHQEIRRTLPVKRAEVIVLHHDHEGWRLLKEGRESQVDDRVIEMLLNPSEAYVLGEQVYVPQGLCYVIGQNGSNSYVLWVDNKENFLKFNSEELNWLRVMANYSSIVYENLFLIERLVHDLEADMQKHQSSSPWMLRLLFGLSENERRKLASDLHDSALQEQLNWYRRLEVILADYDLKDDLREKLFDIKEGLLDVIHQIRETCNELRPPLLKELGIADSLNHLFEYAQLRNNYAIDFLYEPIRSPLSDEQTLALYRIVQELLRNAGKHANASRIVIELCEQNGGIDFKYQDNGKGMQIEDIVESFEHMGLSGIRERVVSMEGHVEFESVIGEGFKVNIHFPLELPEISANRGGSNNDSYLTG
ncbi:ATP-binding protein [Paenibacillus pini]|uniref:histidine kinase n=1 Tax=Paenibacillus pini JCM 16418 TaxID=1236976 RepID=W7Y677_9BACL|nr:ATP-binding protein [Paenibacillus pini]GAF06380.1 hypothetical protein JCM16418_333 [Paenibacillus pini JCM 16418]